MIKARSAQSFQLLPAASSCVQLLPASVGHSAEVVTKKIPWQKRALLSNTCLDCLTTAFLGQQKQPGYLLLPY